ncbi:MAG: C10 family peptidase [Patescibacteria group bacterium]|nr:C10 family peptidase [Patescibacteria group bacterium]
MTVLLRLFLIVVHAFVVLLISQVSEAKEIDGKTAKQVAKAWFINSIPFNNQTLQKGVTYSLIEPENYAKGVIEIKDKYNSGTLAYVIELQPRGFIIVAPDDNINPIIGYSENSNFSAKPSEQNALLYLIQRDMTNRIKLIQKGYASSQEMFSAQNTWVGLLSNYDEKGNLASLKKIDNPAYDVSIGPLLSTTWGQDSVSIGSSYANAFNYYTPNRWVCGCVATAGSQILKYYNWPSSGTGSHSYVHSTAGTLSANFGTAVYSWSDMVNLYGSSSTLAQRQAVGLITSHFGIAVDMNYGSASSGSYVFDAANAFLNYFRSTGTYLKSSISNFYDRIYTNITTNKPLMLGMTATSGGGHAVVVDGVQHNNTGNTTKYYHINFGWEGTSDAWYNLGANIVAAGDTYSTIDEAALDIVPSPALTDPGDTNITGSYSLSWNVSSQLGASKYKIQEGEQAASVATLSDGAENGTGNWTIDNSWEASSAFSKTGSKSFRGYVSSTLLNNNGGYYSSLTLNKSIYVTSSTSITYYWKSFYFDSTNAYFQVSTDGLAWNTLKTYSTANQSSFTLENGINLSSYVNKMVYVRFVVDYISGPYYDGAATGNSDVGFFIDDFSITNGYQVTWTTIDSTTATASKSITGKVSGNYYYKVQPYRDSQWWGWSNTEGITVSGVVPVELASFVAAVTPTKQIELKWATESETNNLGFEIQASSDKETWETIKFISGYGTTSEYHNYNFIISFNNASQKYFRLKQIDYNGTYTYSEIITIESFVPTEFSLSQNYPNPFNPSTTIQLQIPENAQVLLTIYNITGQVIKTLFDGEKKAGFYNMVWDGTNNAGLKVSSGVYIYRLKTNKGFTQTRKMVLMK